MQKIQISVVIPCFDEMANLQKGVFDKVIRFFDKKKVSYEIIVVDDGSTDGSYGFIEKLIKKNPNIKLLKKNHMGKAGAITAGILTAKGEFILFTDMDQATPIEEIDKLLPYFEKDYDIVIGSRNNTRKGAPWSRLFISRANIVLRKLIVGLPELMDTQCGFKVFRHDKAYLLFEKLNSLHDGFKTINGSSVASGYDVEMLFLAKKLGYSIKEVPVSWLYVETRRVNPLNDSLDGLKDLLMIKWNDLMHVYA